MTGKSSCASLAPSLSNRSKVWSTTQAGRLPDRSILFTTTIAFSPWASALRVTKRVCGMGPSTASTSSSTPSTMDSTRSTSPPKSACPGVSTMLMRVPPYSMAQFFARMVMPRSRSMSLESMMRSPRRSWAAKVPDCFSRQSTRVVLPWSTCAMMAMLRIGRFMVVRRPAAAPTDTGAGAAWLGREKRVRRVADSGCGRLLRPARCGRAGPGSIRAGPRSSAALDADPQRHHRHAHLDEEGDIGCAQAYHGADEQQRYKDAELGCKERICEQRHHHQRHQQRGDSGERDGNVDVIRTAGQHGEITVKLGRFARMAGELILERAGPIDDAREAVGQHAERRRHPGQQEYGCDR